MRYCQDQVHCRSQFDVVVVYQGWTNTLNAIAVTRTQGVARCVFVCCLLFVLGSCFSRRVVADLFFIQELQWLVQDRNAVWEFVAAARL